MSATIGPDGKPPKFDGAAWISEDGRYWWNGTAWMPIKKPRGRAPIALIVIGLVIVVGIGWVIHQATQPKNITYGVTNAKIDSTTQIEFDYTANADCSNLFFDYKFFDSGGKQVDEFKDNSGSKVTKDQIYHFTISANAGQVIDPSAKTFTADPTCQP